MPNGLPDGLPGEEGVVGVEPQQEGVQLVHQHLTPPQQPQHSLLGQS